MAPVAWVYTEFARWISPGEKVRIIVQSHKHEKRARKFLKKAHDNLDNVEFVEVESDRSWTRDFGPMFVVNEVGQPSIINFKFNSWARYRNWNKDNAVAVNVAERLNIPRIEPENENGEPVVLEGGAIDVNGKGTLLTTEECLLDQKRQVRNPGFVRADYEQVFEKYLGATNTIWLGRGIAGDDTHGHVDDFCRFVNEDTVVLCEAPEGDVNYGALEDAARRLKTSKLEAGNSVNVVRIPMPDPVRFKSDLLPASYANFYICNHAVLVPTFNCPKDRMALGILSELFPDRHVVGIHSVDLILGLGGIHCLTQQQPKGQ